jgi:hypothetical protein
MATGEYGMKFRNSIFFKLRERTLMQVKKIHDEEDKYCSVLHVNIAIECSTCIPTYINTIVFGVCR